MSTASTRHRYSSPRRLLSLLFHPTRINCLQKLQSKPPSPPTTPTLPHSHPLPSPPPHQQLGDVLHLLASFCSSSGWPKDLTVTLYSSDSFSFWLRNQKHGEILAERTAMLLVHDRPQRPKPDHGFPTLQDILYTKFNDSFATRPPSRINRSRSTVRPNSQHRTVNSHAVARDITDSTPGRRARHYIDPLETRPLCLSWPNSQTKYDAERWFHPPAPRGTASPQSLQSAWLSWAGPVWQIVLCLSPLSYCH